MRAILRVGIITGAGAVIALYALQRVSALGVVLGILATGIIAGMGAAKWLEWAWYGKQLDAGWKTGAIACGLGGLGALLSLVITGPRSIADLSTRSQLLGVDLGPFVHVLSFLGWVGVDFLAVLLATALGIGLSALASLLFAFGKSGRTVDAITQARHAAQAINRTTPLDAPLSPYPFGLAQPGTPAWHTTPLPNAPHATTAESPLTPTPAGLPQPGQPAPNSGRGPSTARPVERELDTDEREALEKWARDHQGDQQGDRGGDASTPHSSAPSSYLNSPAPAAKRSRKKQQTRDWLC